METKPDRSSANKVWDSIRAYTVQCAECSKWRVVPTKEIYEEIRETIDEQPFTCDRARQWRHEISCENESDVRPEDPNWRWAMDRPNIPRTPDGWQRIIRARSEGASKFADVYYVTPSNKRLRSMVELTRYLDENPQFAQDGVAVSQFSFQPPVAFEENSVPKRRARSSSRDMMISGTSSSAKPMLSVVPYVKDD